MKGAPDNGFGVQGNDASLFEVRVWNSGTGVRVDPDATTCGTGVGFHGNAQRGIDLAGTYAEVKNSILTRPTLMGLLRECFASTLPNPRAPPPQPSFPHGRAGMGAGA